LHLVVTPQAGLARGSSAIVRIAMALRALAVVLELMGTAEAAVTGRAALDLPRGMRLVAVRAVGVLGSPGSRHGDLRLVTAATAGPPLLGPLMGIVARRALVAGATKLLGLRPVTGRA